MLGVNDFILQTIKALLRRTAQQFWEKKGIF